MILARPQYLNQMSGMVYYIMILYYKILADHIRVVVESQGVTYANSTFNHVAGLELR